MKQYAVLIITLLIYMLVLTANLYSIDTRIQCTFLLLFLISGMSFFKFDVKHPFVWLSPFIFLYNNSVVVLDFLSIRSTNVSDKLIFSTILSTGTIFLYFSFFSKKYINKEYEILKTDSVSIKFLYLIYLILFLIIILNISFFLKSGITSKNELIETESILNMGYIYKFFIFIGSFLFLKLSLYKKNKLLCTLIGFTTSLFISLIIGERDIFLTYLLLIFFIAYIVVKPTKIFLYTSGFIVILLIPVLGYLKNIFSKDIPEALANYNIFLSVFQGEFLSAGRNFETILNTYGQWDFFYGKTFLWDLGRSLIPSFIYTIQNSIGWFNNTFHQDIVILGRGYGFSFIAEGYINFSYYGIIFWYIILSMIVHFFYKNSFKSTYRFMAYIYMIPYFIYVQRGDMSNIISPLIKQLIIFLILISSVNNVLKKIGRRNKGENTDSNK